MGYDPATTTMLGYYNSLLSDLVKADFAQNRIRIRPFTKMAKVDTMPQFQGYNWIMPNIPDFTPIYENSANSTSYAFDTNPTAGQIISSGVKIPLMLSHAAHKVGADTNRVVVAGSLNEAKNKALQQALNSLEIMFMLSLGQGFPMLRADLSDLYAGFATATSAGSTDDIFTSTDLGALTNDALIGGRWVGLTGPGAGQCKCIDDSVTSTGLVESGSETIAAPTGGVKPYTHYMSALEHATDDDPASYAYASGPRNFPVNEYLTVDIIMAAEYYLHHHFLTDYATGSGYRLFLDDTGLRDLKNDPVFVQIMQNVGGMYFSDPYGAMKKGVVGTEIVMADYCYRSNSTVAGSLEDAAYLSTGRMHYYSMVGRDAFWKIRLGVSVGQQRAANGNINLRVLTAPDHTNNRPGFYSIIWDYLASCGIPLAGHGLNIACESRYN